MKGGDYDSAARDYVARSTSLWLKSSMVGDLDDFTVRRLGSVFSLWNKEEFAATVSAKESELGYVIDDIWVDPKYRGQKLLVKLLLFLRTRENMNKLVLGDVHSDDTVAMLRGNGLKLFRKHWINNQGKVREFSPDTIDEFYGAGHWKLVLENHTDFSSWPRYNSLDEGYIKTSYDVLVSIFNLNEDL